MDDIWDDDAVQIARPSAPHRSRVLSDDSDSDKDRPSKRARTTNKPLFNPDSDEDEGGAGARNEDEIPPDVGALFDGLDDDDDNVNYQLPAQLDMNQLQRESDKRVAVDAAKKRLARGGVMDVLGERTGESGTGTTGAGADGKAPKAKRVVPKLDEQRLLERDGLGALVRRAKEFKIKGKGHEVSDLNRLMQMYQLWAHKMFPKMQFQDTVERVERLCRSKRMHVALSTWRDIDKAPGPDVDLDIDTGDHDEVEETQHPPTSSPARVTLEPGGPPIRQSQADREIDEDEEEMWRDMMDAMEAQNAEKEKQNQTSTGVGPGRKEAEEDFGGYEEEDWAIMDEMEQETDKPLNGKPAQPEKRATEVPSSPPRTDHDVSSDVPPDPAGPSEDDDDDFYAMYEP